MSANNSMHSSMQAEQSVIGSLMLDNDTYDVISDKITEHDFHSVNHQIIFRAIKKLAENSQPFDIVTMSDELKSTGELDGVGGLPYLIMLHEDTPTAANIEAYARILVKKSLRRRVTKATVDMNELSMNFTVDNDELLEKVEACVSEITATGNDKIEVVGIKSALAAMVERIEQRYDSGETMTGVPTGLIDLDAITNGLQRKDMIVLAARPSMGKCFSKGTQILMYSGEVKAVEDIQVGDVLMGDDSTPRHVLSLANGREAMYWVRQNKAMDYRVNESHILSLKRSRTEGKHSNGDVLNLPLTDYINSSTKFKNNYKGYKVAVDFMEKPLLISPYFLGLWLGDGSSASPDITTPDKEIVDYLTDYAEQIGLDCNKKDYVMKDGTTRCPTYSIVSKEKKNLKTRFTMTGALRDVGVLNNKHIPDQYLINSRENRLQLLAGLIDSDGHYLKDSKMFEITQKIFCLAQKIKFLCDSLGYRTKLTAKRASIKKTGFECTVYRVQFSGNLDEIPVKIARKKAVAWTSVRTWNQTGIKVEYDKVDDYYGFEIDGNHLFLLEDMTVVHNTAAMMRIVEAVALQESRPNVLIFSIEMPETALTERMIASVGRIECDKIRTGKLEDGDWARLTTATVLLSGTKIHYCDTSSITLAGMRTVIRRVEREHGKLSLIAVDYLQLIDGGKSENETLKIGKISEGLKKIAKDHDVPMLALSQLNRGLESRADKRPMMSDLRQSGAIEQTADLIIMLYRDEVYNKDSEDKGIMELIVTKHRNGSIGTVRAYYEGKYTRVDNLQHQRGDY